ncbi:unnamed protein product [Rotaria socialis]|uniref:Uncharacterized protein n=1 Tax=Rotaria socialis TaxID=392032 RepID=A0A818H970_9BILA|nr:unnamed protein product [Rotaria socialis]
MITPRNSSICVDQFLLSCSELVECEGANNTCNEPEHLCLNHSRCHDFPICYPVPSFNEQLCPPISTTTTTSTATTTTETTTTSTATTTTETTTTSTATTTTETTTETTTTSTATTTTEMTTTAESTSANSTTMMSPTLETAQELGFLLVNISANATWIQNGTTIAGGKELGDATNQLNNPHGVCVDHDQTVVIADYGNHRIIEWKKDDTTNGQVVAGGKGPGNGLHQLDRPTDVLIDNEADSLIICDRNNQRVVRWSRQIGTTQGEILIDNITCYGLALDEQRYLYISHYEKHVVRGYELSDKNGTLVAGFNGEGNALNQLNGPTYLFVDRQQNVYVSDNKNHRVMKWAKDAKEGIVVAGGKGEGNALTQLNSPYGIFVDMLGTLYVVDRFNDRVMRWTQEAEEGTVIVGGNGQGAGANQFNYPVCLFFDRHSNLYVADRYNNRVQQFSIE